MATVSTASLIDGLRRHRLLDSKRLEKLASLQSCWPDPLALAKELIRRGWLTAYQAKRLLQGRGHKLILGSYILLDRLGEGGMGQVFTARHRHLRRMAAVKLIRKDRLSHPGIIKRFQREVRAAAALDHPHIVRAYDADKIGGTHLLVMEYVEGATDLGRLVQTHGPLGVEQACEYVRQAALGLQHAHERGLVHRDIKPSNLLVTVDRKTIKLLDLGLARLDQPADDEPSTVTQQGMVMGSADYIAPEQVRNSHTADIRADIYGLGCTLYFLLTGQVPFPSLSISHKLLKHQWEEPQPIERLRSGIPSEVAAVVRQMMAKKPADRYQTPAEVAVALSSVLSIGSGASWQEGESSVPSGAPPSLLTRAWAWMTKRKAAPVPTPTPEAPKLPDMSEISDSSVPQRKLTDSHASAPDSAELQTCDSHPPANAASIPDITLADPGQSAAGISHHLLSDSQTVDLAPVQNSGAEGAATMNLAAPCKFANFYTS